MARTTSTPVPLPDASRTEASGRPVALNLLLSLRPGQWTKNLLVFAGLLFGRRLFEPGPAAMAAEAFAIFCALSGAVYLLNDVADREADRQHPLKRQRPIASEQVSVAAALSTAAVLGTVALAWAFWLAPQFGVLAAAYLVLQAMYSGPLKHIVIIDVLTI